MGGRQSRWRNPFPDRTHEINARHRTFNSLNDTHISLNATGNADQLRLNNVNNQTNIYNQEKTGYDKDNPIKTTTLSGLEGDVTTNINNINDKNTDINDALASASGTALANAVTYFGTKHSIRSISSLTINTNEQNKNIYTGMNRTNHSLNNTIKNIQGNHTIDSSRIYYQLNQTAYFSIINNLLWFAYMFLLLLFTSVIVYYRLLVGLSMFNKVTIFILLLLVPFISPIYYRYIV